MARRKAQSRTPTWNEATERWMLALTAAERSTLTIDGYLDDLDRFSAWYQTAFKDPPELVTVTSAELRDWKKHQLEAKHAPQTINRRLAAVRSFLRWCGEQGWTLDVQVPKSVREVRRGPHWLSVSEERALVRAVVGSGGKRDTAIVLVMLKTGLRVDELVSLTWGDLELSPRKGELVVRRGKGAKQRVVPIHLQARQALAAIRPVRPIRDEPVFHGQRGPLTVRGVQQSLERYGRAIGVDLSPHTLRHTFAKRLVDAGVPLHVVARLMGHESTKTTEIYVTPSQEDLQGYVDRLSGGEDAE
jgi:integrase/recombinase XerC